MFKTTCIQFEQQAFDRARKQGLLQPKDRVLVAVSGGPDSVALLQWLYRCRSRMPELVLGVVHIHHGLRGEEADGDAEFVERLCHQMKVPCFIRPVPISRLHGGKKGHSLQEIARCERYQALEAVAEKFEATKVALGHTQDDQAETIVMWMLRGAGAAGLAGMQEFRQPFFIRPLLKVSRKQILEYLESSDMPYRVDSSNAQSHYVRNRIRQNLLPVMRKFNPNILEVLSHQSDILHEEDRYLDHITERTMASVRIDGEATGVALQRDKLLALPLPIQRRVIMKAFRSVCAEQHNPPYELVESLLGYIREKPSGRLLRFRNLAVDREYNVVRFILHTGSSSGEQFPTEIPFPVPGAVLWPISGQFLQGEFVDRSMCSIKSDPFQAYFDGDEFSDDLVIRTWRQGDYFFPFGFGGRRKKIQDFFSDIKLGRSKRTRVPLLVAPEGVLWIGGFRSDHRFRVTSTTKRVLRVRLSAPDRPV